MSCNTVEKDLILNNKNNKKIVADVVDVGDDYGEIEADLLVDSFSQKLNVSPENWKKNNKIFGSESDINSFRFETDMAKKIRDKRSKKKKHILHEAKLILPKAVTKKVKKYNPIVEEEIPDEVEKNESLLNTHPVSSCSTQYLNRTHSSNETNPDELASYFEQILFIPKPMSLMAELMYA